MDQDQFEEFEQRKRDHIRLSMQSSHQATGGSGLDRVHLVHEAFPELDFSEISLAQNSLSQEMKTPLLISSMTAGHKDAAALNSILASACERRGWMMGVGSQRKELTSEVARKEWQEVRKSAPNVKLLGNIGLAELIKSNVSEITDLAYRLEAVGMIVHANPLQECIQPEGGPNFRGGLSALSNLVKEIRLPVIVKETGCGFSQNTLRRLTETGVAAVDVSGYGGTHWGRIEGSRCEDDSIEKEVAKSFSNWGESTVDSLLSGLSLKPPYELWASGGVRSGLDVAKLLAMGASVVGMAQPILQAALQGEQALDKKMELIEYEVRTAMLCTGSERISELQDRNRWQILESTKI